MCDLVTGIRPICKPINRAKSLISFMHYAYNDVNAHNDIRLLDQRVEKKKPPRLGAASHLTRSLSLGFFLQVGDVAACRLRDFDLQMRRPKIECGAFFCGVGCAIVNSCDAALVA